MNPILPGALKRDLLLSRFFSMKISLFLALAGLASLWIKKSAEQTSSPHLVTKRELEKGGGKES